MPLPCDHSRPAFGQTCKGNVIDDTPMNKSTRIPIVDFDQSDSPIYLQLITLFRRQIEQGYWAVGERLASIDTLAQQFGVATGTVRQALAFLEREGLIQRKRRLGTIVLKRPDVVDPIFMPRSRPAIAALLRDLTCERVAPASPPTGGPCEHGTVSNTYRYARAGTCVMIEKVSAPAALFSGDTPPLARIDAPEFARHRLHQTTTIGTASTANGEILGLPVNAAVGLVCHVLTDADGATVLESEWLIRGDVVTFVERFGTTEGSAHG